MATPPDSRNASEGAPVARPSEPGDGERRCVIVLDRDVESRVRAEAILTMRGYRVVATSDPALAATAARQEVGGLVLADLSMGVIEAVPGGERRRTDPPPARMPMPDREGYALLCSLEVDPDALRCPVVFLKEKGDADRPHALRMAIVGFLARPLEEAMLLEEVKRALARRGEPGSSGSDGARAIPGPGFEALPRPLLKALVVDGDAGYRQFIRGLLVPHGFEVYEAGDGEEGLRTALNPNRRPWLILTDVNMPGMDGFEFCRRVRRHALLRHTPLVFLSGWDDYWERYHGIKLGADDYLSKQTPARELLIRIQLTLKRYADVGTRTNRGAGMEGGIELIGVPGMLQMCHLGRFTGICEVRSGMQRVQITFRDGQVVAAETNRARGAEAVYELLSWTRGHFEFLPGDPGEGEPLGESFDHLLLEGCRRLDEQRRDTGPGAEDAVGFKRVSESA
jgi:DNA-binding response OmpR family regulator